MKIDLPITVDGNLPTDLTVTFIEDSLKCAKKGNCSKSFAISKKSAIYSYPPSFGKGGHGVVKIQIASKEIKHSYELKSYWECVEALCTCTKTSPPEVTKFTPNGTKSVKRSHSGSISINITINN